MKKNINFIGIPKKGKTTVINIFVKRGSKHESENVKGISHFIEHLCFKGSEKLKQEEIADSIERYGGDLNAYTAYDVTNYWAKISNRYKDRVLNTLKEFVLHPIFPIKEINKERNVVFQEMKMYEDSPKMYAWDLMNSIKYDKESGYHGSTIGTKKSLNSMNRNIISDYYLKNYTNPTIVIVGDVRKRYEIVNKETTPTTSIKMNTPTKYFEKRSNLRQANILIGSTIKSKLNLKEQYFSFLLLDSIFNDMSGRLFRIIRERNGLVYRIRLHHDSLSEQCMEWNVALGLEKKNINKAYKLILQELNRPISKNEMKSGIIKLVGELDIEMDNSKTISESVIKAELDNLDYRDLVYNYKKNIIKVIKHLNEFVKEINFNKNFLVGIIPKS